MADKDWMETYEEAQKLWGEGWKICNTQGPSKDNKHWELVRGFEEDGEEIQYVSARLYWMLAAMEHGAEEADYSNKLGDDRSYDASKSGFLNALSHSI